MTELERTANYLRELARRYTAQGLVYAVALAIAQPEAPLTDCRLSDHLFAWRTVRRLCDLDCQDSPSLLRVSPPGANACRSPSPKRTMPRSPAPPQTLPQLALCASSRESCTP